METATLLITCPDRPGLVAAVSNFLFDAGANIVHADQHVDAEGGLFLQRVQFEVDGPLDPIAEGFAGVAGPLRMQWSLRPSSERARVAVLVSRLPHCLGDLLARWEVGDLPGTPAAVISNHPDHAELAAHHEIPYHHLPITPGTRERQEHDMLDVLTAASVDLVVLARYMQVLSPLVVDRYPSRIINIHHSFLPAFTGGRPYHQAYERGVKVIGATAHYVTADLDEGPIIEQDVAQVSHRDEVADLARKGRDLEKVVLARAVRAHLEHRVLVYRNRTAVFG